MKTWKKPEAKMEVFQANEVIAACYNVQCLVPSEDGGFDLKHPSGDPAASQYLHSGAKCGAADGTELITDENNNIISMIHGKAGQSTGVCVPFEDAAYSIPKTTAAAGDMIYFITAKGSKSWYHRGTAVLAGNHS